MPLLWLAEPPILPIPLPLLNNYCKIAIQLPLLTLNPNNVAMKMLPWVMLSITVFSSCYSYKVFPKEYRKFEYTGERKSAFVLNPELKKEYAILSHSGIFN